MSLDRHQLLNNLGQGAQDRKRQHDEFVAKFGPDYDQRATVFSLNKAEQSVVDEWTALLNAEIVAIQKRDSRLDSIRDMITNEPYYGAVGGGLTYRFTPTSLGTICVVREAITGKELNVAEATNWFFYD